MDDKKFMTEAIAVAREGMQAGQSPFGAVIVKDNQIVARAHNVVWQTTDPTAHAEVNAIRIATKKLGTIDLTGCVIYSTTEPCPMCFSAIHWAKIDKVVFGARIEDAQQAGFNELQLSNEQMKDIGKSTVKIQAEFMREQCARLFADWKISANAKVY